MRVYRVSIILGADTNVVHAVGIEGTARWINKDSCRKTRDYYLMSSYMGLTMPV